MWFLSPLAALLQPQAAPEITAELTAEIVRVVDGDTLDVRLDGEVVTLRLLSVDTEERIHGRPASSPTKPETVFGEETAQWAVQFFASLGRPIGLAFPEGRRRDPFGRLLAHVLLPDGRDYNLLLVAEGRSPYFNKYGNDRIAHEAFVQAQSSARAAQLGIWSPATNRARTPGAPSAIRPYAELLPWWEARAAAIEGFRARSGATVLSCEDAPGLWRAHASCRRDPTLRVTVFGAIERFFDEPDGALTVLLHPGDAQSSLRAALPASERPRLEPFLRASTADFRQSYLYASGRLERNARGLVLSEADWVVAEPAYPPPR